jgi:uncharacterized protein (TIGR02001 family)
MRMSVLSAAVVAAASMSGIASAQQAAAPASPVAGNMSLVTDYRFRGISQTLGRPAIQGGFDYAHPSGVYLGNWNSNVSEAAGYPGGNLEMDFYGGWKKTFGDFGVDVGLLEYYYPGSKAEGTYGFGPLTNPNSTATNSGTVHNSEFYVGGSWKWLTVKWFYAFSDYFMVPDTKGTNYLDLSGSYDMGGGWGVVGHVGHLKAHNFSDADYTDYKLGVTKDVTGWLVGATFVGSNAKGDAGQPYAFAKSGGGTYDAGKPTVVLSVSKTF